jgi:hypothetical protein
MPPGPAAGSCSPCADPRALRAYARLGLALHPAVGARGRARGVQRPAGVRPGTLADLPLTAAVDRRVRGAADGAANLLRAALLHAGDREAEVEWITSGQAWAIRPCVEAGLQLHLEGAVFLDGDVGPFTPYLPNGAFL